MFYVYCIESTKVPGHTYIGFTQDPKQRLIDHNNRGCNPSTAPLTPWKLKGYIAFDSKQGAMNFERYLKTGSVERFCMGPPSRAFNMIRGG